MNRGQSSAKAKRPRRSGPKKGAARVSAHRAKAVARIVRESVLPDLTPPDEFPADEEFMRV